MPYSLSLLVDLDHHDPLGAYHVDGLLDGVDDAELARIERRDLEGGAMQSDLFVEPRDVVLGSDVVGECDATHPWELRVEALLALIEEPGELVCPDGSAGDVLEELVHGGKALPSDQSAGGRRDHRTEFELASVVGHDDTHFSYPWHECRLQSKRVLSISTQDEVRIH